MASNAPPSPGRGLRRWGGGIFWFGFVVGILSIVAIIFGARGIDTSSMQFQANGTSTMEEGVTQTVVIDGGQASDCTVTSPDGQTLSFDDVTESGGSVTAQFTPPATGDYTIDCANGAQFVGIDAGILTAGGGILLGVLGVLFAGFLVILGGILWLVGRSKRKNARPNQHQGYDGQSNYTAPPPPSA